MRGPMGCVRESLSGMTPTELKPPCHGIHLKKADFESSEITEDDDR